MNFLIFVLNLLNFYFHFEVLDFLQLHCLLFSYHELDKFLM